MLIKTIYKDSIKVKRILKKCCKNYFFFEITRIAIFLMKNVDLIRTQGVCNLIYKFFGTSLGEL